MSAVLTKSRAISRRFFLRGATALTQSRVLIGLPPLAAMFNSAGTAYAAETKTSAIPTRFVLWFNGNGISERYWIPRETGENFTFTPCLAPLAAYREDIHVVTGIDNPAAACPVPATIITVQ